MNRRFSHATSSLAAAALKLCTELANYWRTVLADQGSPYRPHIVRLDAKKGSPRTKLC
jgi:hypothetical protein